MKKILVIFCLLGLLAGVSNAYALTLPGPNLISDLGGWPNAGLVITALQDVTLTSFIFQNRNAADKLYLTDNLGVELYHIDSPSGNSSYTANVTWELSANTTYRLLAQGNSNGRWIAYSAFPTANADIRVDGSYMGGLNTSTWVDFNDLTTTSAVPLPGAVWLLGSGLVGLLTFRRKF